MPYNIEELERKCRRYYLKRTLFFLLALIAIALPVTWAVWQLQSMGKPKVSLSAKESNLSQESRVSAAKARCFALQMLYSKEKFRSNVIKEKKRLEDAGLECYLKSGKKLPDGSKELFLRCNATKTKKEIEPFLKVAKLLDGNAYVVNEECRFAKEYVAVPKVVEKKSVQPQQKRPKADNVQENQPLVAAKRVDVEELKRLFQKRRSYELAIKIARELFGQKEYKEALTWAKRANKLDRNKEEAWLLYAKSLYALGKKEEAKRVLRLFLEYRNSQEAQKLLREWR